jgi:SAM-dependent methyltransferase
LSSFFMGTFKDHFSAHAEGYASYRPTYPATLLDFLASVSPGGELALDCGCGNGQLSVLLTERFAKVVATDASASQIENAKAHPRVEYRVAPAERSGLLESTVDLITAAQAAHWFDLSKFYMEVRRVARPGAAIALIAYGVLHVGGEPDAIAQQFYWDVLGPHWPPERRHVEDGYRSFDFSFAEIESPSMAIETSWNLSDLIGYVDTWSAVRQLEQRMGRGPFETFRAELAQSWGDPGKRYVVRWPLALRVGRV